MAKILGIDHITFAVKDIELRMATFERVFGARPLFQLTQGNSTAISFEIGGKMFNFVSEAIDGEGAFAGFLREKGEGLHHIGLAVDDLTALKNKMKSNGIRVSQWELEGDREKRDELYIDAGDFPAALQLVHWENHLPPSIESWIARAKKYSGEDKVKDLIQKPRQKDPTVVTRAKLLDLDHVCFAVKNRERTVSWIENALGGKTLASSSRGKETSQTFMDIGGYIFNFVSAPKDGNSFFADFLRKKGEDLHHMGFSVDDLNAFKAGMAANGIQIPKWELEGNPEIRDEVLIGTKHAPTVFQIIQWAKTPPSSVEAWMALEEKYTANR